MLKIKSLYIDKLKVFKEFNIVFNPEMTVMVGKIGSGRTTILEIIYNIFKGNRGYFSSQKEFTYLDMVIEQEGKVKTIRVEKNNKDIDYILDGMVVDDIEELIGKTDIVYLPVMSNEDEISKEIETIKKYLIEEYQKDVADVNKDVIAARIEYVKNIFNEFFEDKEFIGIDNDSLELCFKIKDDGTILNVEELNLEERKTVIKIVTLLKNADKEAIVLLDAPENSLDPDGQQKIVILCERIVGKSQCIISSNSPFVVNCILTDQLRTFSKKEGKVILNAEETFYGRTINDVLSTIYDMRTVRNQKMEKEISEYRQLYFNKDKNTAEQKTRLEELQKIMEQNLDPNDIAISMLDFENGTKKLKEKLKQMVGDSDA